MTSILFDDWNGNTAPYEDFRFEVMKFVWGTVNQPYINANDLPFIGMGFNLKSSYEEFKLIAQGVLGSDYTTQLADELWSVAIDGSHPGDTTATLRQRIQAIMNEREVPRVFAFQNVQDMRDVLDGLSTTAESMLSWIDIDVPISEERAVVFSIAFEGADINGILEQMIGIGDRFQTWFEIRYDAPNANDTNATARSETASRRYMQSDWFELYNDPTDVGFSEAMDVALGYMRERFTILDYEAKYDPTTVDGPAGHLTGEIFDHLQPAIRAIAQEYSLGSARLEEVLVIAARAASLRGDGTQWDNARNDDDLLLGDGRGNKVFGQQGNDVIAGLDGSDRIDGGNGNDRVSGGFGNDVVLGAIGADWLDGGNGDDKLDGGADGDRLIGGDGNDGLNGGDGNDRMDGGDGADNFIGGDGNDRIEGGFGNDALNGGGGNDRMAGGDGADNLTGGTGDDAMEGAAGNDRLDGGDGNDRIDGDHGNDILKGADGNDRMNGGNGDDILIGGNGIDWLLGGAGNDRLEGGEGNDTYLLSAASKSIGPTPNPSLKGGINDDVILEGRNAGVDTVIVDMSGTFDIRNVERLRLAANFSGDVVAVLNQFDSFTLTDRADDLTVEVNNLRREAIEVLTGAGADIVRITIDPDIDPSQVLDRKGLTARFNFKDLTAADTIDLTALDIEKIVMTDLNVRTDRGFYLMAPDSQIHLMRGNFEAKTYTNDTNSWFVVKLGDDTPYGPEFLGNIHQSSFDI